MCKDGADLRADLAQLELPRHAVDAMTPQVSCVPVQALDYTGGLATQSVSMWSKSSFENASVSEVAASFEFGAFVIQMA